MRERAREAVERISLKEITHRPANGLAVDLLHKYRRRGQGFSEFRPTDESLTDFISLSATVMVSLSIEFSRSDLNGPMVYHL